MNPKGQGPCSYLLWFDGLYYQTKSFQDQDGNIYFEFERTKFWLFKKRIVLRKNLLEKVQLSTEEKGRLHEIYIPKLLKKIERFSYGS
jgi:NADH:ubiquinone oxidoreductase subunit